MSSCVLLSEQTRKNLTLCQDVPQFPILTRSVSNIFSVCWLPEIFREKELSSLSPLSHDWVSPSNGWEWNLKNMKALRKASASLALSCLETVENAMSLSSLVSSPLILGLCLFGALWYLLLNLNPSAKQLYQPCNCTEPKPDCALHRKWNQCWWCN